MVDGTILRWTKYTLPNGRECYLTQRPDSTEDTSLAEFIEDKKPIVRFQFTDDMVERPPNDPPFHWYPMSPCKNFSLDCVFPFITLMDSYVNSKEKGAIWLHCDSSTMRAPTFFGLYLVCYFPVRTMMKICMKCEYSEFSWEYASISRADRYLRHSLLRDPGIKEFVQACKDDTSIETWDKPHKGHSFYMDRGKK
jgi:hypothetical protein